MSETSQKQIEANQENGKKGGVKTDEGKAISRYNALKHGLLSEKVLMDDEDEAALVALGKKMRSELAPASEIEQLLVDRIVSNIWRLRRALGFEKDDVIYQSEYGAKEMGLKGDADLFFRYETMLEKSIYKALHELQRMQAARAGERPPLPVAVDIDINRD